MKILKYLLILILFLIVVTIGVLFFSGKIIESKLNTKETQIENFKFSLRGNSRVELTQAARRRVARIGEQGFAGFLPFFVQSGKILPAHTDLAPDLKRARRRSWQL